ncbi:hypothetical protein [Microbacterium sp.]|uniref:hypothetical protein n=1 Tax=Microbacterium sp. TaxID=51671 RepID=UPI003A8F5781
MTEETHTSQSPEPTLATIAGLVEQTIVEGQETRARVDAQGQIMNLRFDGFQKQLDAAEDRSKAEFLMLTGDIADVRKHLGQVEEHVGLLTRKAAEHDKRFDAHDKRFDGIDSRLDGIDTRLDGIDTRLDELTALTTQIRDAVLPDRE